MESRYRKEHPLEGRDWHLFHVDQTLEFVALDLPTVLRAHHLVVVGGPQDEEVIGVARQFVRCLHITAQRSRVAVYRDLDVADHVLGTAVFVARGADPFAILRKSLNRSGTEARDLDVVGEASAVTVVVALVDGIGVADDDVADGETVFELAHKPSLIDTPSGYVWDVERITVNPRQMGGVPCIRGLRIPVATVLGMLADGMTPEEIVAELPPLNRDDINAALRYAADRVTGASIDLDATA